jgi:hypothetical protein
MKPEAGQENSDHNAQHDTGQDVRPVQPAAQVIESIVKPGPGRTFPLPDSRKGRHHALKDLRKYSTGFEEAA